jgi:hypothetical protein
LRKKIMGNLVWKNIFQHLGNQFWEFLFSLNILCSKQPSLFSPNWWFFFANLFSSCPPDFFYTYFSFQINFLYYSFTNV